jgi:murein DD-endopeptidase MepM/ murein hydrolase activator NlpD
MPHARPTTRILAIAAAFIAAGAPLAIPALAAEVPAAEPSSEALRVLAPGAPAALAAADRRDARERREAVAERKRRRQPDGPFVPVVGKVDYGTADNAFGASRSGHVHAGHDMFAPAGTPVVAAADAVVADAGSDGGQGNYVHLYDPKREQTYVYMHLIAPAKVATGDAVKAGDEIGGLGCTGSCWGDHLHFEIRDGKGIAGEARDPLPELERWETLDKPLPSN